MGILYSEKDALRLLPVSDWESALRPSTEARDKEEAGGRAPSGAMGEVTELLSLRLLASPAHQWVVRCLLFKKRTISLGGNQDE